MLTKIPGLIDDSLILMGSRLFCSMPVPQISKGFAVFEKLLRTDSKVYVFSYQYQHVAKRTRRVGV
jgi:hypothetical protein